jgi:hypothetical protein
MKKALYITLVILSAYWLTLLADYKKGDNNYLGIQTAKAASATQGVTLSVNVLEYLNFTTTSGGTINFGNLTPGTPKCNASGTVFSVTTNASNGYQMAIHDGSDTNASLVNSGSFIPDITGTIATPITWTTGSTVGLGVTLFAGTQKAASWGTGTTACDDFNKWAKAPVAATTGHTVTGFRTTADPSSWGWKIDVDNEQKTGAYTGQVTFTVVTVMT